MANLYKTVCSSVWSECSAWNREVAGSNPASQNSPVAQWLERLSVKEDVEGSIPSR